MHAYKVHYGLSDSKVKVGFFWQESDQKYKDWVTVKRNRPVDAQTIYQCSPGSREGTIFLEEHFSYYNAPRHLALGVSHPEVRAFLSKGEQTACGWDTAYEATATSDYTAGVPALLMACSKYHRGEDPSVFGPCEPHFDVLLLDLAYKKVDWAGLIPLFKEFNGKWEPYIHVVEKKMSGIGLYQTMGLLGINIIGETPTESKRARAIQGVGAGSVQGWFSQGRVLFPLLGETGEPPAWVRTAKTQMKDFTGAKDAKDDIVDAVVHLITYAIRLGSTAGLLPSDSEIQRVEMESVNDQLNTDPRAQFVSFLGDIDSFVENPFEHTCSQCDHLTGSLCTKFNRKMIAFDGIDCMEFKNVRS